MAACVICHSEDLQGNDSSISAKALTLLQWQSNTLRSVQRPRQPCAEPPPYHQYLLPAYEEAVDDLPPDYTATDALAQAQAFLPLYLALEPQWKSAHSATPKRGLQNRDTILIDWTGNENFRKHVSKKQKKAQQRAQQAKWADSDNEGEGAKDGGEGGGDDADNNSHDGSGGAGGGDGDGNGGGGGDDEGDWDDGGGKKKKKGKKGKKQDEEEEEEKKEEEDHAGAGGGAATSNSWDNAVGDGADPMDEWGYSSGKKNKKKTKKVCSTCLVFAKLPR